MENEKKSYIPKGKPLYKKWWFWGIIVLIIGAIGQLNEKKSQQGLPISSTQNETTKKAAKNEVIPQADETIISVPTKQTSFIKVVNESNAEYQAAPNELKMSAVRTKRGELLRSALGNSRSITNWVGKINKMETNSEGKAMIEIKIEGSDVIIKTWNNALSDLMDNTLIPQESDMYSSISDMVKGERVVFSGSFLPSLMNDFIEEASVTERGSMTDPEFIFKFGSIKKYQ